MIEHDLWHERTQHAQDMVRSPKMTREQLRETPDVALLRSQAALGAPLGFGRATR